MSSPLRRGHHIQDSDHSQGHSRDRVRNPLDRQHTCRVLPVHRLLCSCGTTVELADIGRAGRSWEQVYSLLLLLLLVALLRLIDLFPSPFLSLCPYPFPNLLALVSWDRGRMQRSDLSFGS